MTIIYHIQHYIPTHSLSPLSVSLSRVTTEITLEISIATGQHGTVINQTSHSFLLNSDFLSLSLKKNELFCESS